MEEDRPPSSMLSNMSAEERRMRTLSSIFDLTAELLYVEDVSALLKKIAESVKDQFGFGRVAISILDEEKGIFTDHAMAGYSPETEEEIRTSPEAFLVDDVMVDFRKDCKISKIAYFIPVEKQTAPDTFVGVRDKDAAKAPRRSPDSWHDLDLLYFALHNRRGVMIGYLQVDYPADGKIPSGETVAEIELFATIAAVGIENSGIYKRSLAVLQENEVKTERLLRILELIQSLIRVDDLDVVLQKISDAMASTFGFRKASVSMFSENSNNVIVNALTGYSKDEEDAIRRSEILKEKILEDLKEEHRLTHTGYFIPGETQGDGSDFVFVENPEKVNEKRETPESWHELDLLYFFMHDREGEPLGVIQLDYPLDGKVPAKETMEAMQAFANIATIAVENSTTFKTMDRTKGEVRMYLDLLTHDIGNLVNPVNAYLEMVMAATTLTPVQHKYISSALEASRNMTHLIRNVRRSAQLLELDRAELMPVSLSRALRQSTADSRNAFLGKEVNIKLNLPDQDVWVVADGFLDEVLYNVFTNSIKYDDHGEIVIDVETRTVELETRDYVEIRVIDRGVGVPDDLKDKIFSREFRNQARQDRSTHSKPKGAGMGLSIVKSLLDRYGGRIWVENRIRDDFTRGSVFVILLPKA
jgi:signal transduction histidine kinase/uncharacterized protein YigA (DUF484 family)